MNSKVDEDIAALRQRALSLRKKIPSKHAQKLKKIGGRVEYIYRLIFRELVEVDSEYLDSYQRLGLQSTKLKDYMAYVLNPDKAREEFIENYVKQYIKDHKGEKIKRCIKADGSKAYTKLVGKRYIYPLRRVLRFMEGFKKALLFKPETGLELDWDKFIALFKRYTRGEKMEVSKLHKQIVGLINKFFVIPITEEELHRYFKIVDGRLELNPDGATEEAYLRLCDRSNAREYINSILPEEDPNFKSYLIGDV